MGKEIKFKRVTINGNLTLIKVDVIIAEFVFVERNEEKKLCNFYFPVDAQKNIYELGVAIPMDLLDGYMVAKVEQGIKRTTKEMLEELKDVELPDIEIGD